MLPRFAFALIKTSAFFSGIRLSRSASQDQIRTTGSELRGTKNHDPERMDRESVVPVKRKCGPGGRFLIPWKEVLEVKDITSMPTNVEGGRESVRIVGVG